MITLKTLPLGPLCANCYILTDGSGTGAVIDPGANAWQILPYLAGIDVKYVILTHAHYDHFLAAPELLAKTGARLVTSRADAECLLNPEKTLLCWFGGLKDAAPSPDITVGDGDCLSVGKLSLSFITVPGHSEGGLCIRCESLLFTGDTLFRDNAGRTDLPGGDAETLFTSVRNKLFTINENLTVLPGHDVPSTLFREKAHNPYFAGGTR